MELKRSEKEVLSLSHLYQDIYNANLTCTYQNELDLWSLRSEGIRNILSQMLLPQPHSFLKKNLPLWSELLFQSEETQTPSDSPSASTMGQNLQIYIKEYGDDQTKITETFDSILKLLHSFQKRLDLLQPKIDRYVKRLKEIDPVTEAPRYGEKTMQRVKTLIHVYNCLLNAMIVIFHEPCKDTNNSIIYNQYTLIQILQNALDEEKHYSDKKEKELEQKKKEEEEQLSKQVNSRLLLLKDEEETKKKLELEKEQEIARKAEALRAAKKERLEREMEREKKARAEALLADKRFVESVTKGEEGIRIQLEKLQRLDKVEYTAAINSLHTIFKQIVAHPDNEFLRIIRKNHERFYNDIGRHEGGCELLVAAGFRMLRLQYEGEETLTFLLKEPNVETDMDGWSEWFDLLQLTLRMIEDLLPKKK